MIIIGYALPSRENHKVYLKINSKHITPELVSLTPAVVKIDNVWHYLPSQFRSHVATF